MSCKAVRRTDGYLSLRPKTAQDQARSAHAKTIHGQETRADRKERLRVLIELDGLKEFVWTLTMFIKASGM
jgi:hypothetical protein